MIIKKILYIKIINKYRICFEDLPFDLSTSIHNHYLTSAHTSFPPDKLTEIKFEDIPEKLRNTLEDPFFELHCLKVWANTPSNPNSFINWKESVNFNY